MLLVGNRRQNINIFNRHPHSDARDTSNGYTLTYGVDGPLLESLWKSRLSHQPRLPQFQFYKGSNSNADGICRSGHVCEGFNSSNSKNEAIIGSSGHYHVLSEDGRIMFPCKKNDPNIDDDNTPVSCVTLFFCRCDF